MTCRHTTTARSAKDPREWRCLRCGATVPVEQQTVLIDINGRHLEANEVPPLPARPERHGN